MREEEPEFFVIKSTSPECSSNAGGRKVGRRPALLLHALIHSADRGGGDGEREREREKERKRERERVCKKQVSENDEAEQGT